MHLDMMRPGGDASSAGSYGIMHHNIADNTNGLMIKGNNQIIAHNTIINTQNNRNDIIILSEDCSNTNTWLYNNLAEKNRFTQKCYIIFTFCK